MRTLSAMVPREIPPTAGLPLRWSDFFGSRKESLEAGIASFLGLPAAQIECSGSAALVIALEVLRRRSRRTNVVIPAFTCPLVPLAIRRCGLQVRLCDIRRDRFDFDPCALEACVDRETLCVVPTHLAGTIADLDPVLAIAQRAGAFIIEDAAQALGATRRGVSVGTAGDLGFFSLAAGKGLTLYEGGVVVAREGEVREALRASSRTSVPYKPALECRRRIELLAYRLLYNPFALRFTYGVRLRRELARGRPEYAVGDVFGGEIPIHRVGALRKRIGARALPRLREAIAQNIARAGRRVDALSKIPGLSVIGELPEGRGVWPFIMVLFREGRQCEAALARLWTSGLGVSKLFAYALPDYEYLRAIVPHDAMPNARQFAARHLTISNSPWLREGEFDRILDVIAACARG